MIKYFKLNYFIYLKLQTLNLGRLREKWRRLSIHDSFDRIFWRIIDIKNIFNKINPQQKSL